MNLVLEFMNQQDTEIIEDDDKEVKINQFITDDLDTLQKHYSILLEYVRQLERKNKKLKIEIKNIKGR